MNGGRWQISRAWIWVSPCHRKKELDLIIRLISVLHLFSTGFCFDYLFIIRVEPAGGNITDWMEDDDKTNTLNNGWVWITEQTFHLIRVILHVYFYCLFRTPVWASCSERQHTMNWQGAGRMSGMCWRIFNICILVSSAVTVISLHALHISRFCTYLSLERQIGGNQLVGTLPSDLKDMTGLTLLALCTFTGALLVFKVHLTLRS